MPLCFRSGTNNLKSENNEKNHMTIANFEIDKRARKCFENNIPEDWIASPPTDDIGIDYWVQISKSGISSGFSFFLQLKGTMNSKYKDGKLIFKLSTKHLKQYLSENKPILLIVCDVSHHDFTKHVPYYCWVQEYIRYTLDFEGNKPNWWEHQKTITVKILKENILTKEESKSKIFDYVKNFQVKFYRYESNLQNYYFNCDPLYKKIENIDLYLKANSISLDDQILDKLKRYYWIGRLLQEDSKYKEAIFYFLKAQSIIETPIVSIDLGFSYSHSGEELKALEAFNLAISLDPEDSYALANIGTSLFLMGEFEEALNCHQKAVELNPAEPYMWVCAAATLEYIATEIQITKRDVLLTKCLIYYQNALKLKSHDDYILTEMGLVLFKMYKFKQSVPILERAVFINPYNITAWTRLSRSYVMIQKYREAYNAIERVIELGGATEDILKSKKMLAK